MKTPLSSVVIAIVFSLSASAKGLPDPVLVGTIPETHQAEAHQEIIIHCTDAEIAEASTRGEVACSEGIPTINSKDQSFGNPAL